MQKQSLLFLVAFSAAFVVSAQKQVSIAGACEDCKLMFAGMPSNMSWDTKLSPPDEKGEPLVMTGTIYQPDGKTPAPGIILYVYHTDLKGEYSPAPGQKDAIRHGHLRGWMKTDTQGKYRFTTIRPASYPQGRNPQHIHPLICEPDKGFYWIDEYLFDDDPYLTAEERKSQPGRGSNGVIKLTKDASGTWRGTRDIVLGKNVPGYK